MASNYKPRKMSMSSHEDPLTSGETTPVRENDNTRVIGRKRSQSKGHLTELSIPSRGSYNSSGTSSSWSACSDRDDLSIDLCQYQQDVPAIDELQKMMRKLIDERDTRDDVCLPKKAFSRAINHDNCPTSFNSHVMTSASQTREQIRNQKWKRIKY